jgi:VWFA-related protein
MRTRLLTGLLLLGLLVAPLLSAQLKESVTVEVVDVPVYVFNPSGPVRDLTRDNFELFVNGRKQTIDYFDTIDFEPATAAPKQQEQVAAPPRDPRDRRLFLLLFDLLFSRTAAIDRARRAAVAMIDASEPTDYFAVVAFSQDKGPEFIVPFTNDHAVARHAALTLSASTARDPLAIAISPSEREIVEQEMAEDGEIIRNITVVVLERENADMENRSAPLKRLFEDQVAGFDAIGARLAALEGYKHVIVLSEGFDPDLAYTNTYQTDPAMLKAMNAMFASFRRANAVVDTIDLSPARKDVMTNDVLRMMARETGGQFVAHANDIRGAMEKISTASAHGYRLGFTMPRNAKSDNKIDVKLKNAPAGTTLSFRRGFSATKAVVAPDDGLKLADIILNDIPQSGVAPKIEFRTRPFIDIDVPPEAVANGPATALLYVFDLKGKVVEFKQRQIPTAGTVRGKLELPSGSYIVKVLLRSGDSIGFAKQAFFIP